VAPGFKDEPDKSDQRSLPGQGLCTKIEKIGEIEKLLLKCDFDRYPGRTLKKTRFFKY
jgi:hypothetical protein